MEKGKRIHLMDTLRGISIIGMMLHHLLYDLYVFGFVPTAVIFSPWVTRLYTPVVASMFMLISGISSRFSQSNVKRGIKTFAAAMLVTVVTVFMGQPIIFGVLHFFGCAMVIYGLCGKLLDRIPRKAAPVLWIVLFIVCNVLVLNRTYEVTGLWWLGIHSSSFYSADYYPLLPWIFMYFLGTWLGQYVMEGKFPRWFYSAESTKLGFMGRHALIIYLAHQPVIYGICWLLSVIFR